MHLKLPIISSSDVGIILSQNKNAIFVYLKYMKSIILRVIFTENPVCFRSLCLLWLEKTFLASLTFFYHISVCLLLTPLLSDITLSIHGPSQWYTKWVNTVFCICINLSYDGLPQKNTNWNIIRCNSWKNICSWVSELVFITVPKVLGRTI